MASAARLPGSWFIAITQKLPVHRASEGNLFDLLHRLDRAILNSLRHAVELSVTESESRSMVCDGADGQNWLVTDGFIWRAVVQVQAATPSARPMPSNEIRQLTQWFWRLAVPTRTAHAPEEMHEMAPTRKPSSDKKRLSCKSSPNGSPFSRQAAQSSSIRGRF